ncbi:T9SS type A sorting domain-containing protein [Algibacter pacificus]|uniref:T9SS type A sorting domain-containing protein n=1 Tax=Algibacter pacificus TaxID=2599389 RepID=UPI0011CBD887|nr:proprotein convertase P-domain-containing protein [Algibacter pacificus]
MNKLKALICFEKLWFFTFITVSTTSFGQEICQNYAADRNVDTNILNIRVLGDDTVEVDIPVSDAYVLTDVNITIDISHHTSKNLDISLRSPSGTVVKLAWGKGGDTNGYDTVTFDDESTDGVPSCTAILYVVGCNSPISSGTYEPDEPLSNFNGEIGSGVWTLIVVDNTIIDLDLLGLFTESSNDITLNLCYRPPVEGYLGPGGVGHTNGQSDLSLWLDASSGVSLNGNEVTAWADKSGYGNNAIPTGTSARPSLVTTDVNGYPSIKFDGSDDELTVPDDDSIDLTNWTTFLVSKVDTNKDFNAIYTKGYDALENYEFLAYNDASFHMPIKFTDFSRAYVNSSAGAYSTLNFDVFEYAFSNIGRDVYKNNNSIYTGNESKTPAVNNTDLYIGNDIGTSGRFLNGRISEMIIFKQRLSLAERIITSNYLAAKYGRILNNNDYYIADTSGEDYDYKVAGIGQAYDGSKHTDSQGTGIVRINTPSNLDNDEFLFWGEALIDADYTFSKNYMYTSEGTSEYFSAIDTKWRVSHRNDLGTVSVSINESDINPTVECNEKLKLIVSDDSSFSSGTRTYEFGLVDGVYTVTEVVFNDNDYFTLGYLDQIVWGNDGGGFEFHNGSGEYFAPSISDACKKFLVKAGETAVLSEDATVRELELEAGGTLEIGDGILLTITNGIINNGIIHVLGEGQVVQTHTGTSLNSGTGSFTIPQEGTANKYDYNYWSASVNNSGTWKLSALEFQESPVLFTSEVDEFGKISTLWLQTFNGTSGNYYSWNQIDPASTSILPGEGFSMKGTGIAGEFTFNGEANDGDYTLSASSGNGYLVGNPYPSDLNADQFIADNSGVIDGTLYFWEQFGNANTHILNDYEGGYASYNTLMSTSDAGSGSTKGAPTGKIAVGQGFFVTFKANGSIVFNNGQRDFNSPGDPTDSAIFYKSTQTKSGIAAKTTTDTRTKIWFSMTDENEFKRVIGLGYDVRTTEGYDSGFDSYLANFYPDNFYWNSLAGQLMVQGLPSLSKTDEIDLGVEVVNSGNYTFAIDKSENLPENTPVYLKDKDTNTYYNLLEDAPVTLTLVAGTNYANRYAITYAKQAEVLNVDAPEFTKVTLSYSKENQQLSIHNYPDLNTISSLKIYSLTGQVILALSTVETNTIQLPKVANGIYVFEIEDRINGKMVRKFVKN